MHVFMMDLKHIMRTIRSTSLDVYAWWGSIDRRSCPIHRTYLFRATYYDCSIGVRVCLYAFHQQKLLSRANRISTAW